MIWMIFKFSARNLNFSYWETLEGIRQVVSDGKESACNAGDPGLIPGWEDPQEMGMATHSSILAWRIPWTEETGGLQFKG